MKEGERRERGEKSEREREERRACVCNRLFSRCISNNFSSSSPMVLGNTRATWGRESERKEERE